MAKLTDPDSYSIAVNATATTEEVEIQTGTLTLELRVAGNLDDTSPGKTSGATAKSVYSFLKEEWLTNPILRRFKFPLKMIFEGSFIWVNGWAPQGAQTRDLFRDAGFEEQVSGNVNACMISLGGFDAPLADLAYYTQVVGFTASPIDYDKTGEINENIDITGLTGYQKSFLREQGKLYGEYNLLDEQGLSAIGFQAYSFPLTNGNDAKVTESDGNIDTQVPYTSMEINYLQGQLFESAAAQGYLLYDVIQDVAGRWAICTSAGTLDAAGVTDYTANGGTGVFASYFGEELIGSTYYAFNREVDAGGGTDTEVHEFMMRQLRQVGDINDNLGIPAGQGVYGTVNGKVARLLDVYVGDTMVLQPGVVLRNFDANSTNSIKHQPIAVDSGGLDADDVPLVFTEVSFPFVAAGNFVFSNNFVSQPDVDTVFTVYFDYLKTYTASTIATTVSAGSVSTITDSGSGMVVAAGEYFTMEGFTDPTLNGLWLETGGAPTNASVTATKQNGDTVVNEIAGNSITTYTSPYESPGAEIVNDNGGTPLDAQISSATIGWDFDYTNNNQGGRTAGSNAPCTVVAIAKDGAEWIDATFTITPATGINVPVNGGDERNYENT